MRLKINKYATKQPADSASPEVLIFQEAGWVLGIGRISISQLFKTGRQVQKLCHQIKERISRFTPFTVFKWTKSSFAV